MTSIGRFMQFPPFPQIPEARAATRSSWSRRSTSSPRRRAPSCSSRCGAGPSPRHRADDPGEGPHYRGHGPGAARAGASDGMLLRDFTPEAIDALVDIVPGSPLLSVEIRQVGGALGRPPAGTVRSRCSTAFLMYAVGGAPTPELKHAVEATVDRVMTALAPWSAPTTYANFTEHRVDLRRIWPEHIYHCAAHQVAGRPGRPDPGEPPDPGRGLAATAGLRARLSPARRPAPPSVELAEPLAVPCASSSPLAKRSARMSRAHARRSAAGRRAGRGSARRRPRSRPARRAAT